MTSRLAPSTSGPAAAAARHSAAFNGADELALMLLDVLSNLDEMKVCVAYDLDGQRIDTFPGDSFRLARCQPVYTQSPTQSTSTGHTRAHE